MNANSLFERDVLMEPSPKAPRRESGRKEYERKEPTIGALTTGVSVLEDRKLNARDAFERRNVTAKNVTAKNVTGKKAAIELSPRREPRLSVAPKAPHKKATSTWVWRALGLLLLLSAFAGIVYLASKPIAKILERPLKSVAVEGQFEYLSKDRAMALILEDIDGDFLQINLDRLKAMLEADPWVEHVFLSRRWPDTLVVKVAEQKPIARWDANGFLNQRGEIIRVKETDKLVGLPWLQGNEASAREIMQQYEDLSTLLRSRGLEIITLSCDNKKSWRIKLKNDIEIAIGRDQVMEKMRRFVTVYDNFLSSVWSDVKAVDVRYTNGVSVRWVTDSVMANKYLKVKK